MAPGNVTFSQSLGSRHSQNAWSIPAIFRPVSIFASQQPQSLPGRKRSRTTHIPRWVGSWSHSDDDPGKVACAEPGIVGPEERDEIERLLEKIETALDLLDKAGPSGR
jgi:hypothetical protein